VRILRRTGHALDLGDGVGAVLEAAVRRVAAGARADGEQALDLAALEDFLLEELAAPAERRCMRQRQEQAMASQQQQEARASRAVRRARAWLGCLRQRTVASRTS
jgi:hypothetical protein